MWYISEYACMYVGASYIYASYMLVFPSKDISKFFKSYIHESNQSRRAIR